MSHYKTLFDTLSERQRDVLGLIAINQDAGHHPRTLRSLEDLGLIASTDEVLGGGVSLAVRIKRYCLPLPVHIAWCSWCSESQPTEKDS